MPPIFGIKHPAYLEAISLLKTSAREAERRYLVETDNFVGQALSSSSTMFAVFALSAVAETFAEACEKRKIPLYTMGAGLIQKIVGTGYETSVASIAIVGQKRITQRDLIENAGKEGLVLACETIQDPRNVGVLVRTAEAAGCTGLLLSEDSAEAYSRAAVRSSTGSILRLPLCITPDFPAALGSLKESGIKVIATSAKAKTLAYHADLRFRPLALCVGNETSGMTEAAREVATEFISLPMAPEGASSLNVTVAAGVLLYEAVRQRL